MSRLPGFLVSLQPYRTASGLVWMTRLRRVRFAGAAMAALLLFQSATPVLADTIEAALIRSYQNNPPAQCAARVRPVHRRKRASGAVGLSSAGRAQRERRRPVSRPDQPLRARYAVEQDHRHWRAAQCRRNHHPDSLQRRPDRQPTRAAESQVSAAREGLRVLEQSVLFAAATIYMDYLRDAAIVEVQRNNTRVLEQTLKQTREPL